MDLTDRNNEKFTKMIEILGKYCQVTFYYNYRTMQFKYWGISRGGRSPSSPWDEIIERYVDNHYAEELVELAKHEVKTRGGLTVEERAEKAPIIDGGEGVRRFYNGGRVD